MWEYHEAVAGYLRVCEHPEFLWASRAHLLSLVVIFHVLEDNLPARYTSY